MGKRKPISAELGQDVARPLPGKSMTTVRVADTISRGYELGPLAAARGQAAGLLLRVRDLLMRDLDALLAQVGTSNARYQVLAIVCRSPDGLLIGEVAARASVHPTTMTSTIDRLRRDGLIKRRTVPTDRRAIRVVPTPEGQKLYEQARDLLIATEFGLAVVEPAIIDALLSSLDNVAKALEG